MSWPLVKLADAPIEIADGNYSSKYPKSDEFVASGIPFLSGFNIVNGVVDERNCKFISEELHATLKKGHVQTNDVLITTRGNIGNAAIVPERLHDVNINAQLVLLRPNQHELDSRFLKYIFSSPNVVRQISAGLTGSALKQLPIRSLKEIEIPLPPLAEQKRIAAILDKADAIRQNRKQAIDLADEFLRSVFLDMFGDPVTNPKGWEKSSLTKFGDFKNGMNYGKGEIGQSLYSIGVGNFKSFDRILGTATLSTIELNEMPDKSYLLEDGDLLFVRSNGNKALVGRCLTVHPENEDVTYSGFCIRYRIESKEQLDSDFVNYCMRIPSMKHVMLKGGQGANIQNINQKILSELMLPIPPIELQKQFASTVREFRLAQGRVIESSQSSTNLFDSLSQKAFSGEL